MVLELVHGTTIKTWIQQTADPPGDCARHTALLGVCCALRYLHKLEPPVVHGDLKASNIMVEYHGAIVHAKLLDFGLSRVLTRSARSLGGTLLWKAPEVVKHNPLRPLVSSDIYSYGCLIYFVMTGSLPLGGLSTAKVRKVLSGDQMPSVAWPQDARLHVSGSKVLVEGCLQFEVNQRLSIDSVYADLVCWPAREGFSRNGEGSALAWQVSTDGGAASAMDFETGVIWVRRKSEDKGLRGELAGASVARAGGGMDPILDARSVVLDGVAEDKFRMEACQLGVPSLPATPLSTQRWALICAILPWNVPVPAGSCCGFHAALQALDRCAATLKTEPCYSKWHHDVQGQCPKCDSLIVCGECDLTMLECPLCSSPPRVSESLERKSANISKGLMAIAEDRSAEMDGVVPGVKSTGMRL